MGEPRPGSEAGAAEAGPHPADGAPVWLKTGHYGPFVAHRRSYASLPEEIPPDDLTLEQALALLEPQER